VTLNPTAAVSVSLNPASVSLNASQTQQFTASCNNASNKAVTWSISSAVGTISSTGLYTAPSTVTAQQTITVKATSSADNTKSASAAVTLNVTGTTGGTAPPAPTPNPLLTLTLVGSSIQVNWKSPAGSSSLDWLALSGVEAPYWWYITSNNTNGATSGSFTVPAPTTPGLYEFRYYYGDTWTVLTRSIPLAIGTSQLKLTASATTVAPGSSLTLSWSVPNGALVNQVGLFPAGQATDQQPYWYNVTNGKATGSYTITAPSTAGKYEVHLMTSDYVSGVILPITVQ
jgi:hypothetical protein